MTINCTDCSTEFTLSDGEVAFYESKQFTLPKRCKECRIKKKQFQQANQEPREWWTKPAWQR